jgi:hypothetical protein
MDSLPAYAGALVRMCMRKMVKGPIRTIRRVDAGDGT